jgi:hypothetical protein
MKLLKTLRLDPSDTLIFPKAATNEWAVIGTFAFWETSLEMMTGKERQAFRAGFMGVQSGGFSTLVSVEEGDYEEALSQLATLIHENYHAPSRAEAEIAARHELDAAIALADHPIGTRIAMHRTFEAGAYRETFRTLTQSEATGEDRLHSHAKAFTFMEIEEEVDLLGMMDKKHD